MNNLALGQYVERDSLIHRLDARTKVIGLIILMITVFLVPSPLKVERYIYSFLPLGIIALLILVIILLTKVSLFKFLKSLKQIAFLLCFTFIIQMISTVGDGSTILETRIYFSIGGIAIVISLLVIFILVRRCLPLKFLTFILIVIGSIYILTFEIGYSINSINLKLYKLGLITGSFYVSRVFLVIILSTILTLTTKPTDLTSALEWLLHPLTFLHINVSIFAMMMSLALRFIPTLFNETQKILKAQASRGVDFKEGSLKSQLMQVVSLLVPMFVVSFKRAEDLADAMEARGYVPGAKRTKISIMKFRYTDYIFMIVMIITISFTIVWRIKV